MSVRATTRFFDQVIREDRDRGRLLFRFARRVELLCYLSHSRSDLEAGLKRLGDSHQIDLTATGNAPKRLAEFDGTALFDAVLLSSNAFMKKLQGRKALILLSGRSGYRKQHSCWNAPLKERCVPIRSSIPCAFPILTMTTPSGTTARRYCGRSRSKPEAAISKALPTNRSTKSIASFRTNFVTSTPWATFPTALEKGITKDSRVESRRTGLTVSDHATAITRMLYRDKSASTSVHPPRRSSLDRLGIAVQSQFDGSFSRAEPSLYRSAALSRRVIVEIHYCLRLRQASAAGLVFGARDVQQDPHDVCLPVSRRHD